VSTVLISSALANKYLNGGAAWVPLSWTLGLRRLGFDVCFVEQIDHANCIDSDGSATSFETSANRTYFTTIMDEFGLSDVAALVYEDGEQTAGGLSYEELLELAEDSELLINITGHLHMEPLMRRVPRKAYLDLDPGFTQYWHAAGNPGPRLEGHDFYFSIGENIGTPSCSIPTDGIRWRATRPLALLGEWPVSKDGKPDRFTTVASWRGPYGRVEAGGRTFGLKVHEFRKVIELPRHVPQTFELALDIHPGDEKDLDTLRSCGWQTVDPRATVPDPLSYRRYVQASDAEFSVAQGIYVETNGGWFSDRTVCYLASGKPALVQDTGFSRNYPVGEGLVAFRTLDEAIAGVERIAGDYDRHSKAARAIAEAYFDSDKVLERLLDEVGVEP
jgi:hypothetical protein